MYKPNDPISDLKGVGKRVDFFLKRENIKHIGDLINYFPFRHEDLSQLKTISQLAEIYSPLNENQSKEKVVIKGQFKHITTFVTRTRKLIVKAKLYDETGSIDVMWFNSPFIKQQLNEENIYLVTCKPSIYKNKLNITNPTIDISNNVASAHTGRIVPIYFNIEGVTLRVLRKLIKEAVENTEIDDFISGNIEEIASGAEHLCNDKKLVNDRKDTKTATIIPNSSVIARNEVTKQSASEYLTLKEAYLNLHFPTSFELIEKAKDRIALNELIHVKLHSKKIKELKLKKQSNFVIKNSYLEEFIKTIPFELTTDQYKAINEIEENMKQAHPSNVLISGDVGSGKTIVAIASAFNCIKNGGKVVYIAPTVVLAEQVYQEFCKYLQNSEITNYKLQKGEKLSIKLITSKTSKEFKQLKNGAKDGFPNKSGMTKEKESHPRESGDPLLKNIDILIGTHALLNIPNIENFANLVVIDEQHKFGVKQRAKLIETTNNSLPHVLTMTATPIPRSLALAYFNELNIIPIHTKPTGRIAITTKVLDEKRKKDCLKWIKNEVIKETKTYYIVPFIEKSKSLLFENIKNIETVESELKKYFGEKYVWVLHGKLKDDEKTKIISDFKKVKGGVLLSTQVVEVGIDIKDATVIIIESAERFGLASLHQLRGRVGRSNLKSFCFLVPSTDSKVENQRLQNLEKEDNGFKLAELDLKTRGSGEIFGIRQSGEIDLKFVDFNNTKTLENAEKIADLIYVNKEMLENYKQNFFTRDFFVIRDN